MTDLTPYEMGWDPEHSAAALAEGWEIFECSGSSHGKWQVMSLDSRDDDGPVLANDEAAWRLIVQGREPHHILALSIISQLNPAEADRICSVRCQCDDRLAVMCPGAWEPGCDLGSNPNHVKKA